MHTTVATTQKIHQFLSEDSPFGHAAKITREIIEYFGDGRVFMRAYAQSVEAFKGNRRLMFVKENGVVSVWRTDRTLKKVTEWDA